MVPAARWLVVAAVAVLVVAVPAAARVWPASRPHVDAWSLAKRIDVSDRVPFSGEVRSVGALDLPLGAGGFGGLSRLVGGSTDLRVWWRGQQDWRIDRMRTTGETDTLRDGGLSVRWDYEEGTARFTAWSSIRLPDDVDVVPANLASRLFDGVRRSEVSALPARRIAGHSAAGVRLSPGDDRSSISRVDVWADARTGLPLRVDVYDGVRDRPVLTSSLTSLDLGMPPASSTRFTLGSGLDFVQGTTFDEAAAANAFAPFTLPERIAGLARRGEEVAQGAVGVYGRGTTALVAIPMRDSIAGSLAKQIGRSAAATHDGDDVGLEVGPVSVLLVQSPKANFLLTGTVTPETLSTASSDLLRGVVRTR
jgi:hypothetical protein